MTQCYLAPIIDRILADRVNGHGLRACDGRMDRHHCVPQQRIKRRWSHAHDRHVLGDWRNIILVCRKHHDLLERHAIKLSREDYPDSVHEFAAEYGFFFDQRQGWIAVAEPAFACDGIDEAAYRDLA